MRLELKKIGEDAMRIVTLISIILSVAIFGCSGDKQESIAQTKLRSDNKMEKTITKNFILSFNEGLEKAAREKKTMIVDFYTDWCHWCKVMDEKTFNNENIVKKLSDRFVTVRLNAENPQESSTFQGRTFNNVELTRAFGVTGFPSLAFISPEHEIITVMPGYIPAEQFTYILDYIDQRCWEKKLTLDEIIKKKGECDTTQVGQTNLK